MQLLHRDLKQGMVLKEVKEFSPTNDKPIELAKSCITLVISCFDTDRRLIECDAKDLNLFVTGWRKSSHGTFLDEVVLFVLFKSPIILYDLLHALSCIRHPVHGLRTFLVYLFSFLIPINEECILEFGVTFIKFIKLHE